MMETQQFWPKSSENLGYFDRRRKKYSVPTLLSLSKLSEVDYIDQESSVENNTEGNIRRNSVNTEAKDVKRISVNTIAREGRRYSVNTEARDARRYSVNTEAKDARRYSVNTEAKDAGRYSVNTEARRNSVNAEADVLLTERNRRKSWHVGKFEKNKFLPKRRKGSLFGSMISLNHEEHSTDDSLPRNYDKKKRNSWWNIFVPDHWPRSRRGSSTDVIKNKEKSIAFRGKSRSVDHGLSSPFDLVSLRSKVESRFESLDKLILDSSTDGESQSGSKERISTRKMQGSLATCTKQYKVEENDTLTSVAARFDTTPSELAILNRLPARTVFPGQLIRVPIKKTSLSADCGDDTVIKSKSAENISSGDDYSEKDSGAGHSSRQSESDVKDSDVNLEDEMLDSLRPSSPQPDRSAFSPSPINRNKPVRNIDRFLKINVKHITDGQGVVGGVLLVTPNAVMFDPNVSDQLVMERGAESYGVIAPMEFVVNATICRDIAMRVSFNRPDLSECGVNNADIYHPSVKSPLADTHLRSASDSLKNLVEQNDSLDSGNIESSPSRTPRDDVFAETSSHCEDDDSRSINSFDGHPPVKKSLHTLERSDEFVVKDDYVHFSAEDSHDESSDSFKNRLEDQPEHDSVACLVDAETFIRKLEERRKSSLDHHWAVPSKLRSSSHDLQQYPEEVASECGSEETSNESFQKSSCHDSGIDIRDSGTHHSLPRPPKKAAYSDADILLGDSDEFLPPKPVSRIADAEQKKHPSVSFSVEEIHDSLEELPSRCGKEVKEEGKEEVKEDSRKSKMLKRLSYPLSWMDGISGEKEEGTVPSSVSDTSYASHASSVLSKVFSRRSSVGSFIRQQHQSHRNESSKSPGPKLNYHSMVSTDDMPELFVSIDKLLPKPAGFCEEPPMYLRLIMGKPLKRRIPKSTPIMSYGKKKMQPEYWFSVPRNRVDDLYRFLHIWVPHLYETFNKDVVTERGYELVTADTELWDDEVTADTEGHKKKERRSSGEEITELTRESWEVLSMSEDLRRALYATNSLDFDFALPELNGVSEILTEDHRKQICKRLPPRAEGYNWTLIFSTSRDGFSLNSMYRKMNGIDSPIIMVIQDTDENVFGTLTSCALKMSDHFYGNGQSFLFTFNPDFSVFNWTGDNLFFIKGNNESLSIGAGDGKFGIWLDGDLYQGRTETCNTYGNPPLVPQQDFVVKTLECWAFL